MDNAGFQKIESNVAMAATRYLLNSSSPKA